jgi:hypothetical protein
MEAVCFWYVPASPHGVTTRKTNIDVFVSFVCLYVCMYKYLFIFLVLHCTRCPAPYSDFHHNTAARDAACSGTVSIDTTVRLHLKTFNRLFIPTLVFECCQTRFLCWTAMRAHVAYSLFCISLTGMNRIIELHPCSREGSDPFRYRPVK